MSALMAAFAAFCLALLAFVHADHPRRDAIIQDEIAVLLCSHHWTPGGQIRHERMRVFVRCMDTYHATGDVP